MRILTVIILLGLSLDINAQQFRQIARIKLSEYVDVKQVAWVDLNKDTLLDVVLAGKTQLGETRIFTLENLSGLNLFERTQAPTGMADARFVLTDENKDNRADVVWFGSEGSNGTVNVMMNLGDFSLAAPEVLLQANVQALMAGDMNRNGTVELITAEDVSGTAHIRIYEKINNEYTLRFDTAGITITDFKLFDLNRDNLPDIVVSGSNAAGEPVLQQWINKGKFQFTKNTIAEPVNGKVALHDFNEDGYFDLWAVGSDETGSAISARWTNESGELKFDSKKPGIIPQQLFCGDSDSDGLADQWIFGKAGSDKVNQIISEGGITQLDTAGVVLIEPGDFDRDGDLDFVQVIDSASCTWLKLFRNEVETKNQRPGPASGAFAISTFDRTFLYWSPATDDSTASASLTYDVWLGRDEESIVLPSFSRINGRRFVVEHGNTGTNNFKIFEGLTDDRYYYEIQTVDNAYNGSYSVCSGGVLPCFDLERKAVQACLGSEVELQSEGMAFWFSISGGFLGVSETYSFIATKADTVFSFIPQLNDCSKNKAWLIHVNDGHVSESKTIYACVEDSVDLGIPPGWNSITWLTDPVITDQDTVSIVVTGPDTIKVEAHAFGCSLNNTYILKLSKPELNIATEQFRIQKGSAVQLEATSNAERFRWTPSIGLTDATVLNPVASPAQTTQYTLVVTDSVGCTHTGQVLVEVRQIGFIPDLFTPNADGNNDVLMIYGLSQVTSFHFRIFNREGSVVYQTSNIADALSMGWDGSTNGNDQPTGMYYWRVEGQLPDGDDVLLNGTRTGSVFLMR
ncbi:MAG: gliding motility-associated C-terminal domain-containing protein [Cyclobacteriaceae bacterium]|nr:gliding motility-associated C-terminal domain-containing protein [Cyclobacteriaceae bacterium]